ncbi:hypothetical protein BITS_1690 [Bifidobacterium tsurumiense]|uniref:Uncharacterized protein n=1 Tax=Bifidobacterium tsurumiense TaxID=356829 RepID=A0A087EBJ1_9BIFI|nr:hypothetical protein BITS_1690 [Bifidobacterium tsurumiense]
MRHPRVIHLQCKIIEFRMLFGGRDDILPLSAAYLHDKRILVTPNPLYKIIINSDILTDIQRAGARIGIKQILLAISIPCALQSGIEPS